MQNAKFKRERHVGGDAPVGACGNRKNGRRNYVIIHIHVKNRVAAFVPDDGIPVCGNSTDTVQFTFDEEWAGKKKKVARFLWGGNLFHEANLTDDACEAPMFLGTDRVLIGVYAKDDESDYALSSTRAEVPYRASIRCGSAKPSAESVEAYVHESKAFADAAQESAEAASKSSAAAQGSAAAAAASAAEAATYLDNVEANAVSASDFADVAQESASLAMKAADEAAGYRNDAQDSAQAASASATEAQTARTAAQASENTASTAAVAAAQKATAAEASASEASDSASAAKTAATASQTAAVAAQSFSASAKTQADAASEASTNASLSADRAQAYAGVAKDAKEFAVEAAEQALEAKQSALDSCSAAQLYAEQAEAVVYDLEERGFASTLDEHNLRIAILENHMDLDSPIKILLGSFDTVDVPDGMARYAKVTELMGAYLSNTWSDGWYGQGVVGIRAIGEDESVLYAYDFPVSSLPDYGMGRDVYTVKRGENWDTCNYLSFSGGKAFYHHNVYSVELAESYADPVKRNEGDTVVDSMAYSALLKLETPEVTDVTELLGFDGILDTADVVRFELLQLEPADGDAVQNGAVTDWFAAPVRILFEKN